MNARQLQYEDYSPSQGLTIVEKETWITTQAAADIMETTRANVTYLCRENKLRCEKFSGIWLVYREDAEAYIKSAREGREKRP
jgi:hypothetical protein